MPSDTNGPMNVSNLLSPEGYGNHQQPPSTTMQHDHHHQYPTRRALSDNNSNQEFRSLNRPLSNIDTSMPLGNSQSHNSPPSPTPKNVAFVLRLEEAPNYRARLPMRVQIFPHDSTDSIVATVKNFYGLYDKGLPKGVSFEDENGNTLIARYENFANNMIVYVRVICDYSHTSNTDGLIGYHSVSPQRFPQESEPQMLPPQPAQILHYGQPPSRPVSRVSRKQSASPKPGRSQHSSSMHKPRSRSGAKSHASSFQANLDEINDITNGYSSSDGGAGSVTSSRKARSEQLASAEISVDNIVEGGRRKRAKFESSELPLFVPPQVPAPNSISSISPQRRSNGQENNSPFAPLTQRTFSYSVPLQSPQAYAYSDHAQGTTLQNDSPFIVPSAAHHSHRLRDRVNNATLSTRSISGSAPRASGAGVMPTPDPTVASCISDEDVALQLMRLGDASNISYGRTSASTYDDAFSGRADAASSMTSESDDMSDGTEQPALPAKHIPLHSGLNQPATLNSKKRKAVDQLMPSSTGTEPSGDEADGDYEEHALAKEDEVNPTTQYPISKSSKGKPNNQGTQKVRSVSVSVKSSKASKPSSGLSKKPKLASSLATVPAPLSPASLPAQSRKTSSSSMINFQHQLGAGEDDLSSKPRCQRCRKSKKGCDRQRPCQRCTDAGIGVEGCISEEEGNGRKGRYGRHMGVPVKRAADGSIADEFEAAGTILTDMAGGQGSPDKSKKRKR